MSRVRRNFLNRGGDALLCLPLPYGRGSVFALLVCLLGGCEAGVFDWSVLFPEKPRGRIDRSIVVDPITESASYRDTVAEHAYIDGMRRLRLRAYGLVVGLGRNGSTRCPSNIRDQLLEEMYKTRKFASTHLAPVTPEQLIDDADTAVVAIEGEIPAAAAEGTRFDLMVRAIPGTDTLSLEGGWLYPCDLQVFRSVGGGAWIAGKAVANGGGSIFMNPFGRSEGAATKANLREGIVIGGGVTTEDRRLRLILTTPSYRLARMMTDRINERFGGLTKKVADAVSPGEIRLSLPAAHRGDPKHFLSLVQHVFLPTHPGFADQRLIELVGEFLEPDAPHVEIALAWEAMGRTVVPEIQTLYSHPRSACSFHAAVAGLRLNDGMAVEVIDKHLSKPNGPYHLAAIQVLGQARHSGQAARPLRRMLDDADPRIRIAAYKALRDRNDHSIVTRHVKHSDFFVDRVSSKGEPLVYVSRSGRPRIALFGGDSIACNPPMFFGLPDGTLTISAEPNVDRLTLVRKARFSAAVSDPIYVDLGVGSLVELLGNKPPSAAEEAVRGLGFDFSSIVLTLSELCRSGSIQAKFVLEQPGVAILGRTKTPPGRPESDL